MAAVKTIGVERAAGRPRAACGWVMLALVCLGQGAGYTPDAGQGKGSARSFESEQGTQGRVGADQRVVESQESRPLQGFAGLGDGKQHVLFARRGLVSQT